MLSLTWKIFLCSFLPVSLLPVLHLQSQHLFLGNCSWPIFYYLGEIFFNGCTGSSCWRCLPFYSLILFTSSNVCPLAFQCLHSAIKIDHRWHQCVIFSFFSPQIRISSDQRTQSFSFPLKKLVRSWRICAYNAVNQACTLMLDKVNDINKTSPREYRSDRHHGFILPQNNAIFGLCGSGFWGQIC